jgi:hypothetical protein
MGSGSGPDTFANRGPGPGWSANRDGTRCFTEKSWGEIAPHPARLSSTLRLRPEGSSPKSAAGRGEKVVVTVMVNYFQ